MADQEVGLPRAETHHHGSQPAGPTQSGNPVGEHDGSIGSARCVAITALPNRDAEDFEKLVSSTQKNLHNGNDTTLSRNYPTPIDSYPTPNPIETTTQPIDIDPTPQNIETVTTPQEKTTHNKQNDNKKHQTHHNTITTHTTPHNTHTQPEPQNIDAFPGMAGLPRAKARWRPNPSPSPIKRNTKRGIRSKQKNSERRENRTRKKE